MFVEELINYNYATPKKYSFNIQNYFSFFSTKTFLEKNNFEKINISKN
jgi:hypothetical protein